MRHGHAPWTCATFWISLCASLFHVFQALNVAPWHWLHHATAPLYWLCAMACWCKHMQKVTKIGETWLKYGKVLPCWSPNQMGQNLFAPNFWSGMAGICVTFSLRQLLLRPAPLFKPCTNAANEAQPVIRVLTNWFSTWKSALQSVYIGIILHFRGGFLEEIKNEW